MWTLTRETASYKIIWRRVRLTSWMLGKIVKIGLPSALQMAITAFSNVFVQSYINEFGSSCMAGWSSYGKIDKFCMLPIQSVSLSITTFVGQNLGANQVERAKKGSTVAFIMSLIMTVIIMIPIMIFATPSYFLLLEGIPHRPDSRIGTGRTASSYAGTACHNPALPVPD